MDYMTADEMAEAKHKADMDDKMKAMIREILFYVVQCGQLLQCYTWRGHVLFYVVQCGLLLQWRGQVLFYVVLLFFLLVVINGQHDNNSYLQNHNVAALFNKYLHKDVSIVVRVIVISPSRSCVDVKRYNIVLCDRKTGVAKLEKLTLRQTVHTHRASIHQAVKLATAFVRVAGLTASLAESNDSLSPGMTNVTCRLIVKNRDQLALPLV